MPDSDEAFNGQQNPAHVAPTANQSCAVQKNEELFTIPMNQVLRLV